MRIPLSWIKEFIHLNLNSEEIAKKLTMAGLEVDGFKSLGGDFNGVIAARVKKVEKHPNADKLVVAEVWDGNASHQVVCGASNCREGLLTAFAPVGASLFDEGKEFKIKKTKLRGVDSSGMLCSGKELHLFEDDEGIMELPPHFLEGCALSEIFSDTIFEISLTPNLGHCSCIVGVARELSASTGLPLQNKELKIREGNQPISSLIKVEVKEASKCPRYACRVIQGVKVAPSPDWLKERLEKCGLRSVNNVVDATNYILMEWGHPLHAFDLNRLQGQALMIRNAQAGEMILTLDGKERSLKESDLVIADSHQAVAIAGVMGGLNSEVHADTQNIVLEAAYFDPVSVRKTSKELGLQTDASKRFERGTDPNQLIHSLDLAAALIQKLAGGDIAKGIIDVKSSEFPELSIRCRLSRANKILGTQLSRGEVETIFKNLGFHYQWDGQDTFVVRVPTYRVDLKEEIDLIEEIARLYGFDHISREGGSFHSSQLPPAPIYVFEKEVRARLIGEGLQEFVTCDLIGPTLLDIVQDSTMAKEAVIKVLNPTSVEQSVLRTSLLPGLLQTVKYNLDHQNHQIYGFEIGRVHFRENDQYNEQSVAALVLSGSSKPKNWDQTAPNFDFFDLKGIVESLLSELGILNVSYKNLKLPTLHAGRQASVFVGEMELGSFGEVHPAIQRRLDSSQRILFGEFNLHDLMQVCKRLEKVQPLPLYPGSERDWTITLDTGIPYEKLLNAIQEQSSSLLESVSLVGIYRSEKLGPKAQNVTLHFVYRDVTKTISQESVEAEHMRLTTEAAKKIGVSL